MPFDGAEFQKSIAVTIETVSWRDRLSFLFRRLRRERALAPDPLPAVAALRALEAARDMIEDERDWVQGTFSTIGGRHCAMGALHVATSRPYQRAARRMARGWLLESAKRRGFCSVPEMNDRSTHREVLAAFDEAIATGRAETLALR